MSFTSAKKPLKPPVISESVLFISSPTPTLFSSLLIASTVDFAASICLSLQSKAPDSANFICSIQRSRSCSNLKLLISRSLLCTSLNMASSKACCWSSWSILKEPLIRKPARSNCLFIVTELCCSEAGAAAF